MFCTLAGPKPDNPIKMKKVIFLVLFGFLSSVSIAQNLPDFDAIKLEVKDDYTSAADNAALIASNYILSTPLQKNNLDRLKSLQYIIRWMTGTPSYSFTIDESATKFARKNEDLLGLYLASMTIFVLENKADAQDQDKIKLNAIKHVLGFVKDEKNNVRINSELKKLMEADAKGELAAYLKLVLPTEKDLSLPTKEQ